MDDVMEVGRGLVMFLVSVVVLAVAWVCVGFVAHATWLLLEIGWRIFA